MRPPFFSNRPEVAAYMIQRMSAILFPTGQLHHLILYWEHLCSALAPRRRAQSFGWAPICSTGGNGNSSNAPARSPIGPVGAVSRIRASECEEIPFHRHLEPFTSRMMVHRTCSGRLDQARHIAAKSPDGHAGGHAADADDCKSLPETTFWFGRTGLSIRWLRVRVPSSSLDVKLFAEVGSTYLPTVESAASWSVQCQDKRSDRQRTDSAILVPRRTTLPASRRQPD
jgi:hypothetical protein